jgi:DNA-binding GntR family transcriptional regulator
MLENRSAAPQELLEKSADEIRNAIRNAIVDRRLAPGTKLTEADIGKLFDVSRTLVREALQSLAYEGLVRVEKNRGAFVAYPSLDEARQIFAARRVIEPRIAEEAAAKMTPEAIAALRQLIEAESGIVGHSHDGDRNAEIKASGDFHLALADIAGNRVVARFMDELVARSSLVIALYGRSTVSSCGHFEHVAILKALEIGDVGDAQNLMLTHLVHIEDDLDLDEKKGLGLKEALRL